MGLTDILTNTVLVPTSGSLDNLPDTTIVGDLASYSQKPSVNSEVKSNNFQVRLTSNGKTTDTILCQQVTGLSAEREVEKKRAGGNPLYEVKLPGRIKYGPVTMYHLYTNSTVFLDWLINGSSQGGALLGDVEIKIGDDTNGWVVYTLRDAFPTQWRLGNIKFISVDEIDKLKTMSVKDGEIPLEEITIAYGRMDYSIENGSK